MFFNLLFYKFIVYYIIIFINFSHKPFNGHESTITETPHRDVYPSMSRDLGSGLRPLYPHKRLHRSVFSVLQTCLVQEIPCDCQFCPFDSNQQFPNSLPGSFLGFSVTFSLLNSHSQGLSTEFTPSIQIDVGYLQSPIDTTRRIC